MAMRTLALARCIIFSAAAQAGSTGPDIDKVNGSIRVDDGQLAGDLETVNGSIRLGNHAKADSADTVNGSIEIGDDTELDSAETVNGTISLGERARVRKDVDSVNGAITLERGADVNGKVSVGMDITFDNIPPECPSSCATTALTSPGATRP